MGFAGRIYDKNNKTAKYMNSPETPIYNKSKILYGMNVNKNNVLESKSAIIVEGYLDLIQLYQAGFQNVLAVSGTAFTEQHAVAVSKLCKTIYLAYDGDQAGQDAAIRAGYIIIKNNMEPKIIDIPNGLDPDDWVQNEGSKPFNEAMENAKSLIEFHYEKESVDFTSEQSKIDFINKVIIEISNIENPLSLELLIKQLSDITGFDINSILKTIKMNQAKKNQYKKNIKRDVLVTNDKSHAISSIEKELINFCFTNNMDLRMIIKKYLNTDWLESSLIKEIYNQIYMHLSSEEMIEPEIIMNELINENARNLMAQLIFDDMEPTKNIIIDCLCRIEKNMLQKKINDLRATLKNDRLDSKQKAQNLEEINIIQKKKNNLMEQYQDA